MTCELPRAEDFLLWGLAHHLPKRFLEKMEVDEDGCWIWNGGRKRPRFRERQATHITYELFIGPVPEGMELDHYRLNKWDTSRNADGEILVFPNERQAPCSVLCVNPQHVEPVSRKENMMRAGFLLDRCRKGHAFTPENTRHEPNGRRCLTCDRQWRRERSTATRRRLCLTCGEPGHYRRTCPQKP